MSLPSLPTEVVSWVCRYLGLSFRDDGSAVNRDEDLQSLRLSCRDLYNKTMYDAGVRYAAQLQYLDVEISYKSLCILLHLSKTPQFHNRILEISLHTPRVKESELSKLTALQRSHRVAAELEATDIFSQSSATVHLLAECFRWLGLATELAEVIISIETNMAPIFEALALAHFPRRVLHIGVDVHNFHSHGSGLYEPFQADYSAHLKAVHVRSSSIVMFSNSNSRGLRRHTLRERLESNERGYHIQSYCPGKILSLAHFFTRLSSV
jgi:hypothetical protein